MINRFLLLDVAPEGAHGPATSAAGLTMIGVALLLATAADAIGFIFLLRWFKRARRSVNND